MTFVELPIDRLSNRALDAIEAKQFQAAARLCRELLHRYPEAYDGHARFAELRQAQARFQEAANHYDTVLDMIRQDPHGADPETLHYFTELRDQALALIQP